MLKAMTRCLALLAAAVLLLSASPAALAQGEAGPDINLLVDPMLNRELQASALAVLDGAVYLKAENGLYRWRQGEQDAALLMPTRHDYTTRETDPDWFNVILSDGQGLWALNNEKGRLFPLSVTEDQAALGQAMQLDWSMFIIEEGSSSYTQQPELPIIADSRLYLLHRTDSGIKHILLSFDLKTGERRRYNSVQDAQAVLPWRDGKLLTVLFDQIPAERKPPALAVFDPAGDTVEELGLLLNEEMDHFSGMALAYEQETDTLYIAREGEVWRRTALGAPERCAYLPADTLWMASPALAVLPQGRLAAMTAGGLAIRSADPARLADTITLTIAGFAEQDVLRRVGARMPGVRLVNKYDLYNDNEALVTAMLTGATEADLYVLDTRMHRTQSILRKGYLAPLGEDSAAAIAARRMYPMLQSLVTHEGRIFGLPVGMEITIHMARPGLFEKTGLPLPATFFDLCDNVARWSEIAEEYPNYQYTESMDYKDTLFRLGHELYRAQLRGSGQQLRYDTPLFRRMVARLAELDTSKLDVQINWDEPGAEEEFFSRISLLEPWYGYSPQYAEHRTRVTETGDQPIMLSADDTAPPALQASASFLSVNPRGPHVDRAMEVLNLYADAMDPIPRAMLMPDENDPISNPRYEQDIATEEFVIRDIEQMIAAAQKEYGRTPPEYVQQLEAARKTLAEAETTLKYLMTADDMQRMRQRLDSVYIASEVQIAQDSNDIFSLYEQMASGALPLEQFIRQADDMLRKIELENR
ncbi:MAG: hypothetical protein GX653_08185 [Clostridiales bacterium]|nr:hypothetical protein [Clostridiales bacterium]